MLLHVNPTDKLGVSTSHAAATAYVATADGTVWEKHAVTQLSHQ